jgi:hypothetical protein
MMSIAIIEQDWKGMLYKSVRFSGGAGAGVLFINALFTNMGFLNNRGELNS